MNETGENNYLSNPYVLIGGALIIYWIIQRRNIAKQNANALKEIKLIDSEESLAFIEEEARKNKVPVQLVKDARKMSKIDCAKAVIQNQTMLNEQKMSNDDRNKVLKMVDYLENQIDKK